MRERTVSSLFETIWRAFAIAIDRVECAHAQEKSARLLLECRVSPFFDQCRHSVQKDGHNSLIKVRANRERLQVHLRLHVLRLLYRLGGLLGARHLNRAFVGVSLNGTKEVPTSRGEMPGRYGTPLRDQGRTSLIAAPPKPNISPLADTRSDDESARVRVQRDFDGT